MAQKTKNERITENLVRDTLRDLAYFAESSDIRVEEQKSNIEAVKRLMRSASKSGQGGGGSPEFIISSASTPDFLLIFECKADTKDHFSTAIVDVLNGNTVEESSGQYAKRTQRFAVDGVLHYAERLAKEFNVIALAVSGDTNSSLKISTYLHPKRADCAKALKTKSGQDLDAIIPWADYIEHATFDPHVVFSSASENKRFRHTAARQAGNATTRYAWVVLFRPTPNMTDNDSRGHRNAQKAL